MKVDLVADQGKKDEDTYLIGKNIFGVFDGTNSVSKFFDKSGISGGLIAPIIAKDEFAKNNGPLKEIAVRANRKIRKRMIDEKIDVSKKINLWCTTAAVVRIKGKTFDWLQISDSLTLIIFKDDSYKLLSEDYDHDFIVMRLWKKLALEKRENIRELVQETQISARKKANETWGIMNGEEEFSNFIKSGEEPLNNIKHIIIFTDGLIIPKENPEDKDDFGTFVKLFLEGGLENVKNYVRNLEKDDPKCWKYPRYKQYDDIAAISISF